MITEKPTDADRIRAHPDKLSARELRLGDELKRKIVELGPSQAVDRFLSKYGNTRTKCSYALHLALFFRWLKSRGMTLTPDQMLEDHLQCVFDSKATDVTTKTRHIDLLSEYVNSYMVSQGKGEKHRDQACAAIKMFYLRNNAPLWGDFNLARGRPEKPSPPLAPEDIREVLKALPVQQRAPLILEWQSGVEINRILAMRWEDLDLKTYPMPLAFMGRKTHRRPYTSYAGKDSIDCLKAWRAVWTDWIGREPLSEDLVFLGKKGGVFDERWLNIRMKLAAKRLHSGGLVQNADPRSWRSHKLRSSFITEGNSAGVPSEIVEFFAGHITGVKWIYDRRSELHPEELAAMYLKIEPHVSLSFNEVHVKRATEKTIKELVDTISDLTTRLDRMEASSRRES